MANKSPHHCSHDESINDQHPDGLECRSCGTIGEFVSKQEISDSLKHDAKLRKLWYYVSGLKTDFSTGILTVADGKTRHRSAGSLMAELQRIIRDE